MANSDAHDRSTAPVRVAVDPRVELLSIAFRVAGAEEYQRGRVTTYTQEVDAHFAPFADHVAIRTIRALRQRYGISHDAVIKLAVHLDDVGSLAEIVPLDEATGLGNRWQAAAARDFIPELEDFTEVSGYSEFLDQHAELFSITEARLRKALEEADLEWLDSYFGETSHSLRVVAGMLTGRASYGATVTLPDGKVRYAIVGVESVDSAGLPSFDRAIIEAIVHELCHSYIKPLLDAHADELDPAGTALYLTQLARMKAQAYRSGYTVLNETLTRACTHRYLVANGTPEEIEADLDYNRSRGFVWLEEVSELLERYESDRDRYGSLEVFAPEVVRFFSDYTDRLPRTAAELAAMRPQVTSLVPANGASGVDPKLEAIVVTFDRPMRTDAWSVVGGGPRYPETDTPSYDTAGRVFRLPVKLEPDREYELWLNRGAFTAFASTEGVPLEPVHVRFWTAAE